MKQIIDHTICCDSCGADESYLELLSKTYVRKKNSKWKYRVRKFKCSICGVEKSVYASGLKDNNPDLYGK